MSPRNHHGVPRQTRGHGAEHDRVRATLLGLPCHWCGLPAATADDAVPFSQGGTLADLGLEMEAATLRAALPAAAALPSAAWLNLNVSPGLVLAGEPLRTLIRRTGRRLVLEMTEHTAIVDYPAFRAAFAAHGPGIELAIDDAGSGFASLHHVLEVRPAFVELDRSLVANLETDAARQAMIIGLRHFERTTGCRLLAEGIETTAELATLRALDTGLGQGYLLGRPAAAGA